MGPRLLQERASCLCRVTHTLLHNGRVYTGGGFEPASLVIKDDRIDAVVAPGAETDVEYAIDTGGAYLIPGFVDTHIHLTTLALETLRCDLSATRSLEELYERLTDWAREVDTPFIVGVGFDESLWPAPDLPTRAMLDAIDDKRPLLARRLCGHVGVVNTTLLERLTKHPDLIDADTGLVREHALWEAGRMGDPEPGAVAEHMESAIRGLHRLGVTAIHDIVQPGKIEGYLKGVAASRVPLRIDMLVHTHPSEMAALQELCADHDPQYVRLAGVKTFLD